MIQISLNKGPRLRCLDPHRGQKQTIQLPGQNQISMSDQRPVSTAHVGAELGMWAPRRKQNNIGIPSQKDRSVTHRFSMCGTCIHSVKGTSFSIFYSCVHIFLGLCILAATGILAVVTVILIASICLSGTLLFCRGSLFSCWEVEEWMRGEWSCCSRLKLCSCPNYRLSLFILTSTPICLLCALNLRPIQVHVCRSGPSHATLNPFKAKGGTLELTFQLRHWR